MTREDFDLEGKVQLRSLILQHFTFDTMLDIYRMVKDLSLNNNEKREELLGILTKYGIEHEPIGSGTNRYAALIDGIIFKFALDTDGMIDNMREFKYSMKLQPFVIKVYECLLDGLIASCEYVEVLTVDNFYDNAVRDRMRKILDVVGTRYFIGDIGIDIKNYTNWGFRKNTSRDLVALDFAYCYDLSFKSFRCDCSAGSILYYDENYTSLICPKCHKKFSFTDIRKRISKNDQMKEIGNLRDEGYVVSSPFEVQKLDLELSYREPPKEKEKKNLFEDLDVSGIDYSEVPEDDEDEPENDDFNEDDFWSEASYY